MPRTSYATYLRRLRRWLPLPVDVVFVDGLDTRTGNLAFCNLYRGRFKIEMEAAISEGDRKDTLVHEWAHALSWGEEKEHHGPAWGCALSKCYRVAVEGWRPRQRAKRILRG